MMRPTLSPSVILAALLAACTYLVGLGLDHFWIKLLAKPWPVLALAAWVWQRGDRRIAGGLVAGAIGDICLALPDAFLPGMIAFALGHGAYVLAFRAWDRRPAIAALLPVMLYCGLCFALMMPGTGPLTVPVAIYMLVIGAMIWRAAACAGDDSLPMIARWLPLAGAVLFALSDTLIGINKFVQPLPGIGPVIILTYWAGQVLIAASGVVRRPVSASP